MIFYLAYAVCVFVSLLLFFVCVFLCFDMGVSPAINTNNNSNNSKMCNVLLTKKADEITLNHFTHFDNIIQSNLV